MSLSRTHRLLVAAGLTTSMAFAAGCAKQLPSQEPQAPSVEDTPSKPAPAAESLAAPPLQQPSAAGQLVPARSGRQVGARISTYYLSSGDEIRISVFGYPELNRTVRIPPDGHIFFPIVGEIAVDGMSIPEFRQILADRLQTADEQRIATADEITVRVYRNDDLTTTTIVPSSGRINMPLAGELDLVGLTVEAANQLIAQKLSPYLVRPSVSTTIRKSASGLPGKITDPHVSVEVLAFGGHKILVLGEVRQPGVYLNEGGSRLLEMVARAGGPTRDGKLSSVALIRPATETSPPRTALVDLQRAIKDGGFEQNPPVQRGDVIYVPKTTIANVAQFFEYVYAIVRPLVAIESGIWLGQNIEAGPRQDTPNLVFQ